MVFSVAIIPKFAANMPRSAKIGKSGKICFLLFGPFGPGKSIAQFPKKADRLYVADVSGDWREEIIVLSGMEIHIHHNPDPNPRPEQDRLWKQTNYIRSKQNYNYYCP